jgi:hypothetical protein
MLLFRESVLIACFPKGFPGRLLGVEEKKELFSCLVFSASRVSQLNACSDYKRGSPLRPEQNAGKSAYFFQPS